MQELCPLFTVGATPVATQARIAWCFTVQLYAGHRLIGDRCMRKVPVGGDMDLPVDEGVGLSHWQTLDSADSWRSWS